MIVAPVETEPYWGTYDHSYTVLMVLSNDFSIVVPQKNLKQKKVVNSLDWARVTKNKPKKPASNHITP